MLPQFLMLDFETRSAVSIDLSYRRYCDHSSTGILCLGLQFPGQRARVQTPLAGPVFSWEDGDTCPPEIVFAIQNNIPIYAHNVTFDREVYRRVCVIKLGWPPIPEHLWHCTLAIASYYSMPRSLAQLGAALDLQSQKDKEGSKVLKQACKPRRPRKDEIKKWIEAGGTEDNLPYFWWEDSVRLQRIYEYCRMDLETQTEVLLTLGPLPPDRRRDWELDQVINERGIPCDWGALVVVNTKVEESLAGYNQRVRQLTATPAYPNGMVQTLNQRQKILDWLDLQGIPAVSLDKENVQILLDRADVTGNARELLTMRQEAGKSSLAKLETMIEKCDDDWRVRHSMLYHGAHTGRWTGQGIQPHNFPRDAMDAETATAFHEALRRGEVLISAGSLPETVSQALRSFFQARPGYRILASDFAAIEARVTAWVSGCSLLLSAFNAGKCVYRQFASRATGIPEEKIGKKDPERQLGKVAVLGLGYGMGGTARGGEPSKFQVTAQKQYGITLTEDQSASIVKLFRETYWEIPQLWEQLGNAFLDAIEYRTQARCGWVTCGCSSDGRWAYVILPSGRVIWYRDPEISVTKSRNGRKQRTASYMGVDSVTRKWCRMHTWGGTLTENCLAWDTLVVTDSGVKEIVCVSKDDKVWDGMEWVSHDGLVDKGVRQVISFEGVVCTKDHKILTNIGWHEAWFVKNFMQPDQAYAAVTSIDWHEEIEVRGERKFVPDFEPVYDLKNTGPRHRFTIVSPKTGQYLIVHNCVQAISADILFESIRRTEEAGYNVVLSVHDEVVAEAPNHLPTDRFHELMRMVPAWAPGLPIECETTEAERYGK